MATSQQNQIIKFTGGLNLANTELDAVERPGWAETMINYESDIRGGYRRIDGFARLGSTSATTPGAADPAKRIISTFPFFRGVLAVRDGKIYYSTDGITWLQVNKDTGDTGSKRHYLRRKYFAHPPRNKNDDDDTDCIRDEICKKHSVFSTKI